MAVAPGTAAHVSGFGWLQGSKHLLSIVELPQTELIYRNPREYGERRKYIGPCKIPTISSRTPRVNLQSHEM